MSCKSLAVNFTHSMQNNLQRASVRCRLNGVCSEGFAGSSLTFFAKHVCDKHTHLYFTYICMYIDIRTRVGQRKNFLTPEKDQHRPCTKCDEWELQLPGLRRRNSGNV